MHKRNTDPSYDPEEIEAQDPLGEELFAEEGFEDAPDGGPRLDAPGLDDDSYDKRRARHSQKLAGIPESSQHVENTPSADRPDSRNVTIRERGGASKGDPAVGGTRPD